MGWALRKIHDVKVLIQEAIERDNRFVAFLPICQKITEYYIETRYPTGFKPDLHQEDLQNDLVVIRELISLIRT